MLWLLRNFSNQWATRSPLGRSVYCLILGSSSFGCTMALFMMLFAVLAMLNPSNGPLDYNSVNIWNWVAIVGFGWGLPVSLCFFFDALVRDRTKNCHLFIRILAGLATFCLSLVLAMVFTLSMIPLLSAQMSIFAPIGCFMPIGALLFELDAHVSPRWLTNYAKRISAGLATPESLSDMNSLITFCRERKQMDLAVSLSARMITMAECGMR